MICIVGCHGNCFFPSDINRPASASLGTIKLSDKSPSIIKMLLSFLLPDFVCNPFDFPYELLFTFFAWLPNSNKIRNFTQNGKRHQLVVANRCLFIIFIWKSKTIYPKYLFNNPSKAFPCLASSRAISCTVS